MANGATPGDGKTSPFGNGAGRTSGENTMPNNFLSNPRGNANPGKAPRDFLVSRPQQSGRSQFNTADAAAGPLTAAEAASPPATRPGGVGTPGNPARPFRLGGE
jgi:hypothetical protein